MVCLAVGPWQIKLIKCDIQGSQIESGAGSEDSGLLFEGTKHPRSDRVNADF